MEYAIYRVGLASPTYKQAPLLHIHLGAVFFYKVQVKYLLDHMTLQQIDLFYILAFNKTKEHKEGPKKRKNLSDAVTWTYSYATIVHYFNNDAWIFLIC